MSKRKFIDVSVCLILCIGAVFIIFPFYLTIVSAFKTPVEMSGNFFGLPRSFYLDNFRRIFEKPDYFMALKNSLFITGISLAGMLLILPMAAYPISRRMNQSLWYRFLFFFMVAGIFVPFQVKMMPLVKLMNSLGLLNRVGIILLYLAGATCEGIFLYVGYLASMPEDLEQSAYIDGANTYRTYFQIIFPLLKPISATVMIKNGLWIWNDFFMPTLILNKSASYRTLPIFQYAFKSEYAVDYTMAFTAFLLSMIPIMIFYLFLQKRIIGGVMSGAVKG